MSCSCKTLWCSACHSRRVSAKRTTYHSQTTQNHPAAFLAFAGVKSAGAVQVVYFLICLPRTSRSKQTVKRKEITLPFFLFSRMFAIETHPFISDVSMTFTRYFHSCALLEFSRIFAPHVSLSEVAQKYLKSYDFKYFCWLKCNYRISENADISTVCWQSA